MVRRVLSNYALPLDGIHGPVHWARVLENGTRLAQRNGADIELVQLFAVLHDSCRVNEGTDPGHGERAARFAVLLRDDLVELDDQRFELLSHACTHHTDGHLDVRTCWDADRLDLGRVWIRPKPRYLCTSAGRDEAMIRWADDRAIERVTPEIGARWLGLVPSGSTELDAPE